MTEFLDETIEHRLNEKLESMKLDSYEKSQMILFKEKIEAKEGKILRDKLQNILIRSSKR